jgi:hypothetical protein
MQFDDLIAQLATVTEIPVVDRRVGIQFAAMSEAFVPPPIETDDDLGSAQVVLVVAPAAVGKTTIANEIAAITGAPIWNLAETLVGSNSFVGGLAQCFGASELTPLLGNLGTGYQNLEAFIQDIAQVVKGSPSPSVVILARVETAVVAQLMLELAGCAVAAVHLEYFDEQGARRFVDRRLAIHWAHAGKPAVHHRSAAAFKVAVDAVFEFVYGCLGEYDDDPWASDSVRTFLGYAPVLEAIADYLAVENFQLVIADIESTRRLIDLNETGPWAFLKQVVTSMVLREQRKVLDQLIPALQPVADREGWADWNSLYLEEEQVDRVLRRYFRVGLFSDRMPVIPTAVRDAYEDALTPVADQHPFLADALQFSNIVFREYSLAWALTTGAGSVRSEVSRFVRGAGYLPSPLLARFMLASAPKGEDGLPEIRPSDVGLVYESLSGSAEKEGDFVLLLLAETDTSSVARITRGNEDRNEAAFSVASTGDPILFLHRLAHAEVSVLGGVTLGRAGSSFALGPDVLVFTDILETPAKEYVVLGSADEFGVRLEAETHVDEETPPIIKVYAESPFLAYWDGMIHPWYPYRDAEDQAEVGPELHSAFLNLTSILSRFRKHGRDEFAKKKELIDNVVVGRYISDRTADARALLQFLLEAGVLRESRGLYFANLEPLGMSWNDVRTHQMTDQTSAFLQDFLELEGDR